mmetsp:Transcript_32323/g.75935  ORF Transcript_32323/g.75935 Transcript_32323/m.75935 type:complete len:80 (+) Transcript_32323:155-394(+)
MDLVLMGCQLDHPITMGMEASSVRQGMLAPWYPMLRQSFAVRVAQSCKTLLELLQAVNGLTIMAALHQGGAKYTVRFLE